MNDNMKLASRILDSVFRTIGSLPFSILYAISDMVAWFAGAVVGYRRKVIRSNLKSSFPEKNEAELRKIEKGFYRFLGDYFVETLKLGTMSHDEIRSRMVFEGSGEVRKALAEGHNVSLLLGHYCNWEWISSIPLHLPEGTHAGQIYHPLENQAADDAFLRIRSHCGATSIRMRDTLPVLTQWRREGNPFIIGYIADQVPQLGDIHLFVDFLHHDTPVLTGHERLSRMLHATVFYCDLSRPERGRYLCRYVKITDDAAALPKFEMTRTYYRMLENTIRRQPELWLWSHNRWKRGREMFFSHFGKEDAEKRLLHL